MKLIPYHGPPLPRGDEGWRWWHYLVATALVPLLSVSVLVLLFGSIAVIAAETALEKMFGKNEK